MEPANSLPAKLFVGAISNDAGLVDGALSMLNERFGAIDYLSPLMAFDWTDYYEEEMGKGLLRRVASFEDLIGPQMLPEIKIFTNSIEKGFTAQGKRRINIDPGYLTCHNLVLASCKNFSHRVYLGRGVYAEVTLIFRKGEYTPLQWTYPDYRGEILRGVFREIRKRYTTKLKGEERW